MERELKKHPESSTKRSLKTEDGLEKKIHMRRVQRQGDKCGRRWGVREERLERKKGAEKGGVRGLRIIEETKNWGGRKRRDS